jgi:hypothetical protein
VTGSSRGFRQNDEFLRISSQKADSMTLARTSNMREGRQSPTNGKDVARDSEPFLAASQQLQRAPTAEHRFAPTAGWNAAEICQVEYGESGMTDCGSARWFGRSPKLDLTRME